MEEIVDMQITAATSTASDNSDNEIMTYFIVKTYKDLLKCSNLESVIITNRIEKTGYIKILNSKYKPITHSALLGCISNDLLIDEYGKIDLHTQLLMDAKVPVGKIKYTNIKLKYEFDNIVKDIYNICFIKNFKPASLKYYQYIYSVKKADENIDLLLDTKNKTNIILDTNTVLVSPGNLCLPILDKFLSCEIAKYLLISYFSSFEKYDLFIKFCKYIFVKPCKYTICYHEYYDSYPMVNFIDYCICQLSGINNACVYDYDAYHGVTVDESTRLAIIEEGDTRNKIKMFEKRVYHMVIREKNKTRPDYNETALKQYIEKYRNIVIAHVKNNKQQEFIDEVLSYKDDWIKKLFCNPDYFMANILNLIICY